MLAGSIAAALIALSAHGASNAKLPSTDADMLISTAALGQIDPSGVIPMKDGVPGAGIDNWDIATPTAFLTIGQSYALTMTFSDMAYTGACEVEGTITQVVNGKREKIWGFVQGGASCTAGSIYLFYTPTGKLPGTAGPATLTVTLYGDQKSTMKVPLVLQ